MITTQLRGGLGNHMFQIAATYALALDNNDDCAFEHAITIGQESTRAYINNIYSRIKFVSSDEIKSKSKYFESNFYFQQLSYKSNLQLVGYFQSEKYFKYHSKKIRALFEPTDNIIQYIRDKYSSILNGNTVAMHIRRGDYLKTTHLAECSEEYYQNAIKDFTECDIIVFSDDIEWCKVNFKGNNFIFIEGEEDYIDLYLMSMCKNNIIANSSFSWWGAWLNNNKNKKVVAPKIWFNRGTEQYWCLNQNKLINTEDLYCEGWKVL